MVTLGATLALTGRFATQGQQAHDGLRLWAERVNRGDALSERTRALLAPLTLTVLDDASRVAGVRDGTARLIEHERVDLLFGPYGSAPTLAAAEVAAARGRLLWNHGGSTDTLTERGYQPVVTVLAPASRYCDGLLELACHLDPPARRLVLLHGARGTFPAAVVAGAAARAARLGLEIARVAPYPDDPADLPALLQGVARLAPDLLLGVGTTEADLALAHEVRRQRLRTPLVGLVATPIQRFQAELGADADGFLGPSQWEPGPGRPDLGPPAARFVVEFRARFGTEPDYPAAQAYAAGLIVEACASLAGALQEPALFQAARTLDLTTFYGRFRLDPDTGQQVGHTMVVVQWQGGRKVVVWPPERAEAPPRPFSRSP